MGKPSILIPLPSASNNEQHYNALHMKKNGAAVVLNDSEVVEHLFINIEKLMNEPETLENMSKNALMLANHLACDLIARDILNILS